MKGRERKNGSFRGVVEAGGELQNIPKVCSTSTALQNGSSVGDTEALRETAAEAK